MFSIFFPSPNFSLSIYLSFSNTVVIIRFERLGGKIVKKTINSFQDVEDYDLVINCTGFGAKKLCVDHDLVPIRGQVFKVRHFKIIYMWQFTFS